MQLIQLRSIIANFRTIISEIVSLIPLSTSNLVKDNPHELEEKYKELMEQHEATRQRLRVLGGIAMIEKFSRQALNKEKETKKAPQEPGILQSTQGSEHGSWVSRRFRDLHPDSDASGRQMKRSLSMTSPIVKRRDTWVDMKSHVQSNVDRRGSNASQSEASTPRLSDQNPNPSEHESMTEKKMPDIKIPSREEIEAKVLETPYESAITPRELAPPHPDSSTPRSNVMSPKSELDGTGEVVLKNLEDGHESLELNEDISRIRKIGNDALQVITERLGNDDTIARDDKNANQNIIEWLSSELSDAQEIGLKQKMEIEKIRKMERMMLLSPGKSRNQEFLARNKPTPKNLVITSPRNFKLTSQKAETEEMERIFYITKDYLETPNDKRLKDDSGLNQKTKDRIAICKESLSFTVNLSDCELTSIPETAIDNLRKSKILDLSRNRLETLVPEIALFDELEELILSNNALKSIPMAIHRINKLQVLMLNNNQLNSLPSTIGFFYHLTVLDLSENKLTEIPKQIGFLENLRSLNIGHNPRVEAIPREIGYLSNLNIFESPKCSIKELPKELCCLPSLQYIDMSSNLIDHIPPHIAFLTKLSILNLSNNMIKVLPPSLGLCRQLKLGQLDISNNPLDLKYDVTLDTKALLERLFEEANQVEPPNISITECQPPRRLPMLPVNRTAEYEDDVYTLQEKMQCLYKWCSRTVSTYINPSLVNLSNRIQGLHEFDSNEFYDIVNVIKQVFIYIKRSEDSLVKADKELKSWQEEEDELKKVQAFLLNQLLIVEQIIKRSESMLQQLTYQEQIRDIAQIVYIVHFIREMLFILVLRE